MKFKEGVAYIVTKDTIRAFVEDVEKTDLRMYDDIREVKDGFAEWLNFLDYVILFIEEQQVWYDTSLCDEYTVDELLEQRKNILQELDDDRDIYSSVIYGCDCGCGGDSDMEYEQSLLEELYDVEVELKLHGVNF